MYAIRLGMYNDIMLEGRYGSPKVEPPPALDGPGCPRLGPPSGPHAMPPPTTSLRTPPHTCTPHPRALRQYTIEQLRDLRALRAFDTCRWPSARQHHPPRREGSRHRGYALLTQGRDQPLSSTPTAQQVGAESHGTLPCTKPSPEESHR